MDILLQESKLDLLKYDHMLESSLDSIFLEFTEERYITEKKGIISSIEKLVVNVLKALADFFKKLMDKVSTKVEQIKINHKLKELKDILAKKKSMFLNKEINYFDMYRYKKYYKSFINEYVKELKIGLNKDFKSLDDYEIWRNNMIDKLSDFKYKLSSDEEWKLITTINNAYELTKKESDNLNKNLNMIKEEGNMSIKTIEKVYLNGLDGKSMVNYDEGRILYANHKRSFISRIINMISSIIRKVANVIMKHPFVSLSALFIACAI